ncbi:MAG: RsiV family protein [bacterium]|jgi:hypothetical protein|nr:RsiV family protein [bacterium]MDD3624062.1 RsiV family protein [Proteiniphilum sp.]MDD3967264.1 RsiV family protein [Proteiniphilum sp.]MDD4458526.1 RsiV family protein [Proteiniphilum sp.]
MYKQRFTPAVLLMVALLIMSSCRNDRRQHHSLLRFDSVVVHEQIPLLSLNDSTLPFADLSLSFTYPAHFRDASSLTRLQQIFTGTFFGDVRYDTLAPETAAILFAEAYRERYRSLTNSYYQDKAMLKGEMPVWYWYSLDIQNRLLHLSDSLLSYSVAYSDYEGGAHGSHRITYTNIDLNRLHTLTEEDLFLPGYYKPLTEKIVAQLMKDHRVNEPDSLLTKGFFTIEDIVPNNNFWLSDNAIHYAYNQYEIAPYSMGVIDVTIPYSELAELLSPQGAITRYFIRQE